MKNSCSEADQNEQATSSKCLLDLVSALPRLPLSSVICHAPFGVSRMALDLWSDSKLPEFRSHVVLLLRIFRQIQCLLDLSGTRANVALFRNHETLTGQRRGIVRIFFYNFVKIGGSFIKPSQL